MNDFKKIIINKNRGWRGLTELIITNEDYSEQNQRMIFSFSEPMWKDLLCGYITTQEGNNYYVIKFNNTDKLPRPDQQRSVLIKNFTADILEIHKYEQEDYPRYIKDPLHFTCIKHFIKNNNNHTMSAWNNIGVRVFPTI